MIDTIAYSLVGVGLAFDLFGCIGLVRLPDVYNRAQAATKCVTLGTCMILSGVACLAFGRADVSMGIKAVVCAVFVLLTSPVGAHAICRGAYLSGIRLWTESVEDAFAERADQIRKARTSEGSVDHEKAQTP
jgi:multicomponent Na+:H+ antiporter subunit G